MNVVKADDRQVVGDTQLSAIHLVKHSNRGHVVRAHDGSRQSFAGQQLFHCLDATFQRVIALDYPVRLKRNAAFNERLGKGIQSRLRRVQALGSGDERNIAVPQGCEVLYPLPNPVVVIDLQQTDGWPLRSQIDEHQGDVAFRELFQQWLFNAEGHYRDTLDFALQHAANAKRHAFGIIVGRAHQDFVTVSNGNILESLDQLGEEWIGNFRNDEAKEPASARDQGARLGIRKIVKFADGIPYPLGHLGIDGRVMIDGAGDGGDGNLCPLGYRPYIHERRLLGGASLGFGLTLCHGVGEKLFSTYAVCEK